MNFSSSRLRKFRLTTLRSASIESPDVCDPATGVARLNRAGRFPNGRSSTAKLSGWNETPALSGEE